MAAIFPPASQGGVPPGPSVPNDYVPAIPVLGEGPLYADSGCTTVFTAEQINAISSEILAACDKLGVQYNSGKVTNLGEALAFLKQGMMPSGGTRGQALAINASGQPVFGAPIDGMNY